MNEYPTTTDLTYFTARSNHGGHYSSTWFGNSYGEVVSSTAVQTEGGFGWQTIIIVAVRVEDGVDPKVTASRVFASDDNDDSAWYDILRHDFLPVAELWRAMAADKLRGVKQYHIGQQVTEWHGTKLNGPAVMTRRDDVKPGQTVYSSQGFYFEVGKVSSQGLVTQIDPADKRYHSERYDRHLLIPVML